MIQTFHPEECHVGVHAQSMPDKPALILAEENQEDQILTFADYEALSNQGAHLLRSYGLQRGDRMVLFMENNLHFLPLAWAGIRAGLRVSAIATHLSPAEVDYIIDDSGAKAFFTSAVMMPVAQQLRSAGFDKAARFMLGGAQPRFHNLQQNLAQHPETPIKDQSEGVDMLYSSGTTGQPKAVKKALPEGRFGIPASGHVRMAALYGFDEDTIYLHPSPLYHAAPLLAHLRVNRFGGTCVISKKFAAEKTLALIEKYRVTHSQWVPTHFIRLLRLPQAVRNSFDLSSHQVAIHAAAPCPVDIKYQMLDWWGPIIREYYGGSEQNGYVTLDSNEWLQKPGSVGRAIIGQLRICDDSGREVPRGAKGTVYFEDGPVFEYHNDPEKTAASRHPQGWSTLGDIGYVDEDDYLFLTDRKAFMIVSGGVNIYPQEIENLLFTHPEVADVAVFGVPDVEFGEAVKAVIQLLDKNAAGAALEAEIIEFCRTRLSHVKCPRSVDFVEQLPRQENGKLYKRKLRDTYWPVTDR